MFSPNIMAICPTDCEMSNLTVWSMGWCQRKGGDDTKIVRVNFLESMSVLSKLPSKMSITFRDVVNRSNDQPERGTTDTVGAQDHWDQDLLLTKDLSLWTV